jgi:hypothetical protein
MSLPRLVSTEKAETSRESEDSSTNFLERSATAKVRLLGINNHPSRWLGCRFHHQMDRLIS